MKNLLLSVTASALLVTTSYADLIDIQAEWSGAHFGNGASATATFTLDTSLLFNPGISSFFGAGGISNAFQNFQLTVSGATLGNGVFSASDFAVVSLNTSAGTLDFHSELVGQSSLLDLWGAMSLPSAVGDFNLYSNGGSQLTPTGASQFTLRTGGGEYIVLTSFAPSNVTPVAVPETSTWVMGFLALGAVVFMVRRAGPVRS